LEALRYPDANWENGDCPAGFLSTGQRRTRAFIVLERGQYKRVRLDWCFPFCMEKLGEDGADASLLELSGIPT
jgi:hypothetical protein